MLDHVLRIITQAPYPEDQANLPNGLYVLSTYTQLNPRCRDVAIVVRNGTSRPIHMAKWKANWESDHGQCGARPTSVSRFVAPTRQQKSPFLTLEFSTAEQQSKLLEILEGNGGLDELKNLAIGSSDERPSTPL